MSQSTSQSSPPTAPVNRGDLLVSGLFSDFTILCHGERIPVHRSILYGESSFFRSALTVNMKEQVEGIMELPEDVAVIKALLNYLYSANYPPPASKALPLHAGVYVAALKYDIPGLQALAGTKFCHATRELADTALLDASVELTGMEDLRTAAQIIYDGTLQKNDNLRMNLIEIAWRVVTHLERDEPRQAFVDQIMHVPDFAAEIFYRSTKTAATSHMRDRDRITLGCPNCSPKRFIISRSVFEYRKSHARSIRCPYCLHSTSAQEWR